MENEPKDINYSGIPTRFEHVATGDVVLVQFFQEPEESGVYKVIALGAKIILQGEDTRRTVVADIDNFMREGEDDKGHLRFVPFYRTGVRRSHLF